LIAQGCSPRFARWYFRHFLKQRSLRRLAQRIANTGNGTINGLEGLSDEEILEELHKGARFVVYGNCISLIIVSIRLNSPICFMRGNESRFVRGLLYSLLAMAIGIWGIPWGVIYTIGGVAVNTAGGTDATAEVTDAIGRS
jgi:hypothetical protein